MSRPNLFEFATSELSQDAVLCWLASWAGPEAAGSDPRLAALGRQFLAALFKKHARKLPEVISDLNVRRQHKNIDILITINSQYAVCIEDKVGTIEHSDQLTRYIEALTSDGFSEDNTLPVYVQTYEQGTYAGVKKAGYSVLSRADLLEILRPYADENGNAIVNDFYRHLDEVDREVKAFRTHPLAEWPCLSWQGFFCELQSKLLDGEWGYVPNQSGGFMGYWWNGRRDHDSEQYLQLEKSTLCFKVSVDDVAKRAGVRDRWVERILQAARELNFDLVRPARLGRGQTMTVACFNGDYRVAGGGGALDTDGTVARLRRAQEVLSHATPTVP